MTLSVSDLTVRFGGICSLDGVSVELSSGICGLVGPNGAGKTTLFNVISGFVVPVSGDLVFDGESLASLSASKRARWGLRRTFQQEQVVRSLSAFDNVRIVADELRAKTDAVQDALAFVGLSNPRRRGVELSMFERRLVEIARVVVGRPRLVLLDEPGGGLGDAEADHLMALISRIPEQFDAQVIVIDHDMDLVSTVCETTAVLDFGRLIALGPTKDVLNDSHVKRAYLGTEDIG